MFFDLKTPNGLLFIAKQNVLSRSAVKTQTNTGVVNGGIYTPLSTLAQAGVLITGYHLNKQGNPFAETGLYANPPDDIPLYLYVVLLRNTNVSFVVVGFPIPPILTPVTTQV